MSKEKLIEEIEWFIRSNRKICWEAEFEQGEFCVGENKLREFIEKLSRQLPVSKSTPEIN
jgi:hypothetical protein